MEPSLQEKIQLARRLLELRRAQRELRELKQALHEEVDARKAQAAAQGEVEQLAAAEKNLAGRCSYGAPDWMSQEGGSSMGWGPWLEGREVQYTVNWTAGGCSIEFPTSSSSSLPGSAASADLKMEVVAQAPQVVRLQISELPFAMGGVRQAFYARDEAGGRFVVKRPLIEARKVKRRLKAVHVDAYMSAACQAVAQAFCHPEQGLNASISFLPGSVVVLEDSSQPGGKLVLLKEPYLHSASSTTPGRTPACATNASTGAAATRGGSSGEGKGRSASKWVKWTRNDGHIFEAGEADEVIQALTHFSLTFSRTCLGHGAMILDAQVLGHQEAGTGRRFYTLTDPALCSVDQRYGTTDCGEAAMQRFLGGHVCSALCRRSMEPVPKPHPAS